MQLPEESAGVCSISCRIFKFVRPNGKTTIFALRIYRLFFLLPAIRHLMKQLLNTQDAVKAKYCGNAVGGKTRR